MELLQRAEGATCRGIGYGRRKQLCAQKLLIAQPSFASFGALAVLEGDGMKTIAVQDEETSRGRVWAWAALMALMTKLNYKAKGLQSSSFEIRSILLL
jgi:hypothetical protein